MTLHTNQPPWRYAIFQSFAGLTALFLLLGLLTTQLGWFPQLVSVQIALDLSGSTYQNDIKLFRSQGSIMQQEIDAVKAYVDKNASLPKPNLLSVSGFADRVVPITSNFSSNRDEIYQAIERVIQPSIAQQLGGGTNINLVVENGFSQLKSQNARCQQMLVITDGVFELDTQKASEASKNGVKLNFLVVGQPLTSKINTWARKTGGIAFSASPSNISQLLAGQVFNRFNTSPLIPIFLGLAWMSFMWMMLLPIDRFLEKYLRIRVDISGQIALFNAMFWTLATPALLLLAGLVNPFHKC
jgi:Ca-activated chloride channel family protein